jgi:hypothetical protein
MTLPPESFSNQPFASASEYETPQATLDESLGMAIPHAYMTDRPGSAPAAFALPAPAIM